MTDQIVIEPEDLEPERPTEHIVIDLSDLDTFVRGETAERVLVIEASDITPPPPPKEEEPTCPYCGGDFHSEEPAGRCTDCQTPHHLQCWNTNQGCTILACAGSRQLSHFRREEILV